MLGPTRELLPNAPIVYAADSAGFPYGKRSEAELAARVPALLGRLVERFRPRLAVIACNTASTIALDHARAALDMPVVGTVPAIKPAAETVEEPGDRRARHRSDRSPALCRRPRGALRVRLHDHPPRIARAGRAGRSQARRRTEVAIEAVKAAVAPMFDAPEGEQIDIDGARLHPFPAARRTRFAAPSRPSTRSTADPGIARRIAYLTARPAMAGRDRIRGRGLHLAAAQLVARRRWPASARRSAHHCIVASRSQWRSRRAASRGRASEGPRVGLRQHLQGSDRSAS